MTKSVLILFSTMTGLLFSISLRADIYRCTIDGTVQYTDRPCVDGDIIVRSRQDKTNRESQNEPAKVRGAADQNNTTKNQPAAVTAPQSEPAPITPLREPPLWERRNMSAACFSQKYGAWSSGRTPRPTKEERDLKTSEFIRECRDRYRIPQDATPIGTSSQ